MVLNLFSVAVEGDVATGKKKGIWVPHKIKIITKVDSGSLFLLWDKPWIIYSTGSMKVKKGKEMRQPISRLLPLLKVRRQMQWSEWSSSDTWWAQATALSSLRVVNKKGLFLSCTHKWDIYFPKFRLSQMKKLSAG